MAENIEGQCLCGKVKVRAQEVSLHVGACHCDTCRKWGAGPYLSLECGDRVSFEGADYISRYMSSEWAERGFCKECGTHLFARVKEGNLHFMPVSLFDCEDKVEFVEQIFVDRKPAYYDFSNQTKNMTAEEVFEAFAAK